nr:uncharacterized protein LOC112291682 isoform X4 [Physcomitrium patens]|eukprot:XP_024395269.1 uncharacterized protein LOC112291682 isoform X4 [Physcomitrella patens]
MREVLEGLLSVTSSIIGHTCIDDHLFQMQEDLAELVVACEVLRNLQILFALYDRLRMEVAAIPGPIILGLRLLEALTGPGGKMLSTAHETPVNIVGRPLQPTPELKSIQENLGSQKLVDVKKACSNGSSAGIRASGSPDDKTGKFEAKASNKNSRPNLGAVVQLEFHIDGKNQQTMSSSRKLLLKEIVETGLVGLPSLLTDILLQANQRVTTDQVGSILQSNFGEVAISVLRVINNAARLNLFLVQNAFSDIRMEFFLSYQFPPISLYLQVEEQFRSASTFASILEPIYS